MSKKTKKRDSTKQEFGKNEQVNLNRNFFSSVFLRLIILISVIFVVIFVSIALITTESFNKYFIEKIIKPWLSGMSSISSSIFEKNVYNITKQINDEIERINFIDFKYEINYDTLKKLKTNEDEVEIYDEYLEKINSINRALGEIVSNSNFIKRLYILDKTGRVIMTTDNMSFGEDLSKKEIYSRTASLNKTTFIPKNEDFNDNLITYAGIPFFHKNYPDSQLIVVCEFDLTAIVNSIVDYNNGNNDDKLSLFIVDMQSNLFLYNQKSKEYILSNSSEALKVTSTLQLEKSRTGSNNIFISTDNNDFYQFTGINETNWIIGYSYSKSDFKATTRNILKLLVILGVISLVLTLFFTLSIIHALILRKINSLIYIINKVSKGDLSQNFIRFGNDEISVMGVMLNNFLKSIRDSWNNFSKTVTKLDVSNRNLDDNISSSINGIEKISSNIKESKEYIEKQTDFVSETSTAVEQITRNLDSLNALTGEQSENVSQSSTSIEELIINIKTITELTEETNKQVVNLSKISNEGQVHQNELISQITVIAQVSEQLHEANSLISSMAEQTNLLSMNASIEAAHAGESGKGFAVVAEEIRGLSEQVSEQSDSVSQTIYQIQEAIGQVVKSTEVSSASFNNLITQMTKVADFILQIQEMLRAQSQGTRQILHAITELKNISQNVKIGSKEIADGNKQILEAVISLSSVNTKVKTISENLFIDIRDILYIVQEMKDASGKSKKRIKEMKIIGESFHTGNKKEETEL